MDAKIKYDFSAKLWKHSAPGGWCFVTLPKDIAREIRENLGWQEEGWGRMKATAIIENIRWETAIWFDKKSATYLLPVKAAVRKKAKLELDKEVEVSVLV